MADQLIVVISGAGRGIGHALAQSYLSRNNVTVIGCVRDVNSPGVDRLKTSPVGSGSMLHIVKVDSSSATDPHEAIKVIQTAGINHIDTVIANAAVSPPLAPLETVDIGEVADTIRVNALGPLALYQACHPLLAKSTRARFVTISSVVGSIGRVADYGLHVAPSYGASKATLHWITVAAHSGNKWLTAFAVNPGLVQTEMGERAIKHMGLEKAPHTPEGSAEKIMALIDDSSREKTSGRFWDAISGNEMMW